MLHGAHIAQYLIEYLVDMTRARNHYCNCDNASNIQDTMETESVLNQLTYPLICAVVHCKYVGYSYYVIENGYLACFNQINYILIAVRSRIHSRGPGGPENLSDSCGQQLTKVQIVPIAPDTTSSRIDFKASRSTVQTSR